MLRKIYRLFFACLMAGALSVVSADALPSSYFASTSRLAGGRWVKVRVTENGMQELTFDALRQMGFDDPSKVAVFGYPSWTMGSYLFNTSLPDDLPAVPSAIYGDKLVFYGEGCTHSEGRRVTINSNQYYGSTLVRNLDGNDSFYYLTDSYEPLAVEVSDLPLGDMNTVTRGLGICTMDYRRRNPGSDTGGKQIGSFLVGDNCAFEAGTTELYLPYFDAYSYYPVLTAGVTTFTTGTSQEFNISIGQSSTNKKPSGGYGSDSNHKSFFYTEFTEAFMPMSRTPDDIYPITLKFKQEYANAKELAFDYFSLTYPRYTVMGERAQDMMVIPSLSRSQGVHLGDLPESTKVWNITDATAPFEMTLTEVDERRGVVADRSYYMGSSTNGMQIVAFDPARTLCVPEFVGVVANQDLHSIDVPEMLIVSSPLNMGQARRLADLHRQYTGTDVKVVGFEEVCNEFGSGSRHPMAIRRMAKMLYDRDPSRFKALLLFGRAPRDNNGVAVNETPEQFNDIYIPMLHCEDITSNYCGQEPTSYGTDAIYGMLRDDFEFNRGKSSKFLLGGADIQVGRIPAYEFSEALAYVNKVERYLSTPSEAPLWNSAIVFTNQGDGNMHIEQGEHLREIIKENSPSTTIGNYPLDNNTTAITRLRSAISRGVSYMHYVGHSFNGVSINVWDINMDKSQYIPDPPFTLFASCQTQILDAQQPSLQVSMLFNENGGMMGGVGSVRSVYAQYNHIASQMGAIGYFTQGPGATYGQVWQTGRNLLSTNPKSLDTAMSVAKEINTLSFNFIGDPMLPMRVPEGKVKITSVNGEAVAQSPEFNALEPQQLEGAVYAPDGTVDTSFNGYVTIQVYDGNFTTTVPGYQYDNGTSKVEIPARDLNYDDYLMQQAKFKVTDGRFSGKLSFALPHHDGDYNRVTLYAQTDDLLRSSTGMLDNVKIIQNGEIDTENVVLPEITSMYAVDTDFRNGDCLPANFTVYADVEVGSLGLVGASDQIGGAMWLILDDHKRYTHVDSYFTLDTDGNGHLAIPLKELSDGHHSLTFSIADLSGESVSRTIDFTVANVTEGSVKVEEEFCTRQAVIDILHGYDLETTGRVVITDPAGKVVFSQSEASFPFTWNLTDNDGDAVSPGIYSAKVYFKAERRYGFGAPARIIVGKQ